MPKGVKRKASFATPYQRPAKLTKRSTSSTVAKSWTTVTPSPTMINFPQLKLPKTPSLRATKKPTAEVAGSSPTTSPDSLGLLPPALRRASTLELTDDTTHNKQAKLSSSKSKSKENPSSLTKKSSSFIDEGALVTKLSGLKSGSIVGETSIPGSILSLTRKSSSTSKSLSRKLSSVRSTSDRLKTPRIPSGLTKLALTKTDSKVASLCISKSSLIENVDENEMSLALASLRSHLSKTCSKKRSSVTIDVVPETEGISADSGDGDKMDDSVPEATTNSTTTGAHLPLGGLVEVAISFDTTGSMHSCLVEVRAKIQDLVQRLQADIPGIRVAVIAHGDYCDESTYIIQWIDFGASLPEICDFVKNASGTGGGDGPECYELVMVRAREALKWTPGSQRLLIMINDDVPHEPGYTYGGNTYDINWRVELKLLSDMGVKLYGVQSGCHSGSTKFNREMAKVTNGKHLALKDFSNIFDFIMMICYREGNPDMLSIYEQEIRARTKTGALHKDMELLTKEFGMPTKVSKTSIVRKVKPLVTIKAKTSKTSKTKAIKTETTTKAKPKSKKNIVKKKPQKSLKKNQVIKREKVSDAAGLARGPLKDFKWTKWTCAIRASTPSSKERKQFGDFVTSKRYPGYIAKHIFSNDIGRPALYEFGVKSPEARRRKIHVVYFRRINGIQNKCRWDMHLFRHKSIKAEVEKVMKGNCSIWVRRALPNGRDSTSKLKQLDEGVNYIKRFYDYAWKKYIWRRSEKSLSHRDVRIGKFGGLAISHNNL